MKPTYFNVSSSITLFFFLLLFIHSIPAVVKSSTIPEQSTAVDDYIRKRCTVTLYQSLCYSSLTSQYSGPADLGYLTCAAIKVSFTEAKEVANYVASMNLTAGNGQAGPAMKDCTRLTKSSVKQVEQSMNLMVKLVNAYVLAGRNYNETQKKMMKFDINSVQTWMSAGITNQNTCMEGFKDVGVKDNDQVRQEMYTKVGVVTKLISNALALVNSYVDVFH